MSPSHKATEFSPTQRQRLSELAVDGRFEERSFTTTTERDSAFEMAQSELVRDNLARLDRLRAVGRPVLRSLERLLSGHLVDQGFVEVVTPTVISKGALEKMGLDAEHPLWRQVYWVDRNKCLRPMLAPNLYYLLGHLQRIWERPLRLFELGSCFRKETKGSRHLSEFTMLNLVELGPRGDSHQRLRDLADSVMGAAGVEFDAVPTSSEVYGSSLDVMSGDVEIASGLVGPHPLDEHWGIDEPWVGWGFGLERLAMALEGSRQVHRFGRSLMYLDGARLNIQRTSGGREGTKT